MANQVPAGGIVPAAAAPAGILPVPGAAVPGVPGVVPDGAQPAAEARTLVVPRIFSSELRTMMYGFGDSSVPRADSVRLMEELMLHYVGALIKKTTEVAHTYRRERPDINDIKFVIRKDRRKLQRVRYLLDMKTEIKSATSLDPDEIVAGKAQK